MEILINRNLGRKTPNPDLIPDPHCAPKPIPIIFKNPALIVLTLVEIMIGIEVPIVRKMIVIKVTIVTKATIVTEVPIVTDKMTNVLEALVDLIILLQIIPTIQAKHALSHRAFFAKSITI